MKRLFWILFLSFWMLLRGGPPVYAFDRSEAPANSSALSVEAQWETKAVAALRAYVAQQLSFPDSEIDIKLLSQSAWSGKMPSASEEGEDRKESFEVQERGQGTPLGRTSFLVIVKRGGQSLASRWITADVGLIRLVVVAVHPIKRLQPIEQDDVTIHAVRLIRPGDRYVSKPEALIGKRMLRAVAAGAPITTEMVEEAPLIRQGDRVTLVVDIGGLKIMATGRAKEDGFPGRQVAVLNLDSQKIIYGDVVDPSTVRVRFSNE